LGLPQYLLTDAQPVFRQQHGRGSSVPLSPLWSAPIPWQKVQPEEGRVFMEQLIGLGGGLTLLMTTDGDHEYDPPTRHTGLAYARLVAPDGSSPRGPR
jgi:hypothetical protein